MISNVFEIVGVRLQKALYQQVGYNASNHHTGGIDWINNTAFDNARNFHMLDDIEGTQEVLVDSKRFEQVYTPRFSPDGTKVAYSKWSEGGYRDIHVLDLKTREITELMHDRALDTGPAWSPPFPWWPIAPSISCFASSSNFSMRGTACARSSEIPRRRSGCSASAKGSSSIGETSATRRPFATLYEDVMASFIAPRSLQSASQEIRTSSCRPMWPAFRT